MRAQAVKPNQPSLTPQSDMRQSKVLLVGGDPLLPGHANRHFFFGARQVRIAGRAEKLSDALPRLTSTVIDIVLLGREFSPEELLVFAFDAKECGYRGLILQADPSLGRSGEAAPSAKKRRIRVGDFVIDIDSHHVWVRGVEIYLTPQEFALLTYFARHPRELLRHESLLETFWGKPTAPIEPLRVLIQTLRAKVETGVPPRYIVTLSPPRLSLQPDGLPHPLKWQASFGPCTHL